MLGSPESTFFVRAKSSHSRSPIAKSRIPPHLRSRSKKTSRKQVHCIREKQRSKILAAVKFYPIAETSDIDSDTDQDDHTPCTDSDTSDVTPMSNMLQNTPKVTTVPKSTKSLSIMAGLFARNHREGTAGFVRESFDANREDDPSSIVNNTVEHESSPIIDCQPCDNNAGFFRRAREYLKGFGM